MMKMFALSLPVKKFALSLAMPLKTVYTDGSLKEQVVSFYIDAKGTVIFKVKYAEAEAEQVIFIFFAKMITKMAAKIAVKLILEHFKAMRTLVKSKAQLLRTQVSDQFAFIAAKASKNPHFIKAVHVAITSSGKILDKEKVVALLAFINKNNVSRIPSAWKTAPKEVSEKTSMITPSPKTKLDSKRE
jgi:hypothetical protein